MVKATVVSVVCSVVAADPAAVDSDEDISLVEASEVAEVGTDDVITSVVASVVSPVVAS